MYSAPIACLNYIPAIWSGSFRKMVLGTSEANQIYAMKLMLGDVTFLVFPAIYVLLIIWIWRSGRSNLKVLTGFIGTALFTLSLTSSAGVGWHLWGLSLLILLSDWQKLEIQFVFFSLQILVLVRDIASGNASEFGLGFENQIILNIAFTLSAVLGFSWALSSLAKIVNKSDILKLNRKPLLVAIAGNSGVGKDTLADSLSAVFGENNVSFLSGDGYHKYERGNGRWQAKTHLNPEQNRLAEWKIDVENALNRKPFLKSEYDHSIGRFTPQLILKPKDFVISQGLHALDSEISKYADLKVFMEMDEETRIRIKVLRDTSKRGRSLQSIKTEMHKRRKDYRNYILPQRDLADIVIKQSGKVWKERVEISTLVLEIRDFKFVDLLANIFLPYFPNLQVKMNGYESGQIHFNSISTMSRETIYLILKTNLESFGELSIKREQLKSGALGIATAASLLYLENRRRQVGK
jgi:uridine kinase